MTGDHHDHHGHHDHEDPRGPAFFDEAAATWDEDEAKVERARVVAEVLRDAVPLDESTRLLEYGAGTGLVTQALGDAVGPVTLADLSTGMREVMAAKVAAGDLPADARIWDVDLAEADPPEERFDLVVTVLTLHHIPELDRVLHGFAALLDDGGHLAVVDLEEEDGSFHGEGFGGHHGFARPDLQARLETAGFTDVAFRPCHHIERDTGTFPMFLATATRKDRSAATEVRVVEVAPEETHHLRATVLRSHLPDPDVDYPADRAPGSFHLGVRGDDGLVAAATFSMEPAPGHPGRPAARLRGMAVEPGAQGRGLGRTLLEAAQHRLRAEGVELCWANARTSALDFYEANGFTVEGDEFESIGLPHRVVVLDLTAS